MYKIINKHNSGNDLINLTESQLLMLLMSEEDLKNGRTVSQEELDKQDLEWLKEQ